MNFIFIDSSNTCGGIENVLIEFTKHIVKENNQVLFITRKEGTIYHEYLKGLCNITWLSLNYDRDIQYSSASDRKMLRLKFQYTVGEEDYYLIAPFFDNFQLAQVLFGGNKNVRLVHLWGQPENWKNTLKVWKNGGMGTQIIKNAKYNYQKKLLAELHRRNASLYSARAIQVFNEWYYQTELPIDDIPVLPIQEKLSKCEWRYADKKELHILWCGRFDYWKNEAVIHIGKVIEKLGTDDKNYTIHYDVAGFGDIKHTTYVEQELSRLNINMRLLGKIPPDKLDELFVTYDIGIAMGLTVKKMGQTGLPSIVIDSADKEHRAWIKCNWLSDTSGGDAGDGYYFHAAGKELLHRVDLETMLVQILEKPDLLKEYSDRCRTYVRKNYSEDEQIRKITNAITKSTFAGIDYPVYTRPFVLKILNALYKRLKGLREK